MIEVDFTARAIEVFSDGEIEGGIRLLTGHSPDGTDDCWKLDPRKEFPPHVGATVRGLGVTEFVLRERYIREGGSYEIQSQIRGGDQRRFLLDVNFGDEGAMLTFKVGSTLSIWLISERDEPVYQKPDEDLVLNFYGPSPEARRNAWERLEDEPLV
jgi:hypothetical protein